MKAKRSIEDIMTVSNLKECLAQLFVLSASGLVVGVLYATFLVK